MASPRCGILRWASRALPKRFFSRGRVKNVPEGSYLVGAAATVACLGAPALAAWFLWCRVPSTLLETESEESRNRRFLSMGLPTPSEAQRSHVATIKNFLSESEVDELLENLERLRQENLLGELQRGNPEAPWLQAVWHTTYLHTDGVFRSKLENLHNKLRETIFKVDKRNWNRLNRFDPDTLNFRTVEFHEYFPGGQLSQAQHFDSGSLITVDVMLADPKVEFQGGEFKTPEANGDLRVHKFNKGDAVLFLSHKYHNVFPVTEGKRAVLVAELWEGPEKMCGHRCWEREGDCSYPKGGARARNALEAAARNSLLLG
ncbi:hypothetical protein AAMO2058_000121100 [Amorphochlora amoebiformis]